ncbi:V-type ATP synthase subunit F [Candidatus Arthromitus sp. SFB-turkey]|uniref:V-type ATP synthase subunit F n=1 Tax=Candidatus Arthromitus sp. SFB-turkey TaxID=1840217 RepID=UPI0007F51976|nr:V-type ATP synthase subunit F [Candidatus Arthromitus sp. SFB-turkey]OAT86992.1 V-type ATP synthase subunit F [Candidatus Arthromitus sp. SFB-turkey]
MYKVGIVGDKDSIFIFKSLGLEIFPCERGEDAKKIIDKLALKNYAVIFVTENIVQQIMDVIDKYQKKYIPSVVLIPSSKGSLGIGIKKVNDNVEKAVGVNIL